MQLTVSYLDQILVLLVFTVSLNLVMGYAGVFNAAAGAFGAIGGYSLVWLTASHGLAFIPAMLIGVAATAVFGLLVGYAALRLQALWLLLLTLAVQLVLIGTLSGLTGLGGSTGLQAANLNIFGYQLVEPTQVLPVVAVGAVLVFLLCYRIGESPYGRVLRGIRDDETATRSLGKNTFSYKLIVFTLTAAMAGFGGVLLSTDTTTASPGLYGFDVSIQVIAMVIIGGTANMFGSIIGVALVVLSTPFFENVIHLSTNVASLAQGLAYGLALVIVVFFRPQGIIPEGSRPWRWRRPAPVPAVDAGPLAPRQASAPAPLLAERAPRPAAGASAGAGRVLEASVLEVRGLTKSFGGNTAVNDLGFDLRRGKITALIGPNGAGKTTVFNLITGAIPADAGRVRLFGQDITGLRPDTITGLGLARSFQDVRIFPSLTVLENIMLGIQDQPGDAMRNLFAHPRLVARAERAARERAREWLRFIDMEPLAGVRAGSLGFGQQKLIALARILGTESEVLLLDEPGSGIDHAWIDQMVAVVKQVSAAGRTVCIVEHNLEVVGRLADHVCFMELGRLTAEGSFADLTSDPRLTEAYFGSV
jgi:branched-chain amino acid transport system permease protein